MKFSCTIDVKWRKVLCTYFEMMLSLSRKVSYTTLRSAGKITAHFQRCVGKLTAKNNE